MTIHFRPVRETIEKLRDEMTKRLRDEIAEARMDARMPRHFKARQLWKQTGETHDHYLHVSNQPCRSHGDF